MNTAYYQGNRDRLYAMMQPGSLLMLFSGDEIRKTNDEYYPFFADRSFVYFTGLKCRQAVLLALKDAEGSVAERLYLLPPDAIAERWTGTRIKPQEAESVSGVKDVRFVGAAGNGFFRAGEQRKLRSRVSRPLPHLPRLTLTARRTAGET